MSTDPSAERRERLKRLQDLLSTRATQGISDAEAIEMERLIEEFPEEDPDSFDYAAAAIDASLNRPAEMPAALAERLQMMAVVAATKKATATPASPKPPRSRPSLLAWSGWGVAACVLIGVTVWTAVSKPKEVVVVQRIEVPKEVVKEVPLQEPPLSKQRDELKKKAPEYVGEKKTVTGTIVWSDKDQVGYMEVKGLSPLDAAAGTYQLWIVDGERKGSAPIDGGVFKVNADGTAIVRIKPPIQVKSAAAFAITRETEPGGVVVSAVKPENYEIVLTKKG